MSEQVEEQPKQASSLRWLWAVLPVAVFAVLGWFLYQGLSMDPKEIPSVLINKPAPQFDLPALPGRDPGLATSDLHGQPVLVNVFASWCVSCRFEHPILLGMKERGEVPIYGLNYKDKPNEAVAWLDKLGDPYDRIGADRNGRVGIDFGVYGVPETFIIDSNGVIVDKVTGPITPDILKNKIRPLLKELRK